MSSIDADDTDVPWGKYTYALEGLATGCYMEGAVKDTNPNPKLNSQRLRFRVELKARCFILSVAVKLPNAPQPALIALNDIKIERTLNNGKYETVYDGYEEKQKQLNQQDDSNPNPQSNESSNDKPTNDDQNNSGSPKAVEQTASKTIVTEEQRKKVMEIRRAADSLRITITDIDDDNSSENQLQSSQPDDESDSDDYRTLGIVVVGYVRGQTPAPNRIKILLNSSSKLGLHVAKNDRAEVDGLLGLAFLANRRYRQAAELLQRSSELITEVANEDVKSGVVVNNCLTWAAELNLLSAYAYFEHMPRSNDGIIRLLLVSKTDTSNVNGKDSIRPVENLEYEYLDLRTELLSMLDRLMVVLSRFLAESNSLAVRLASARMIEFFSEQLGCAIAPHLAVILKNVLKTFPTCKPFGARERAASTSFSYDSLEECLDGLIDICCRLFPLTEHSVIQELYEKTLVPVFVDGFQEADYLFFDLDAEEEADEVMTTAVSQTLRVIYLALRVLVADARIPTTLLTRLLNILALRDGNPRTPIILRRTAMHAWDSVAKSLSCSANGGTILAFKDHINVLLGFLPNLLVEVTRPGFEYAELDEDEEDEGDIQIIKEEYVMPINSKVLQDLLKKREKRIEIVDRHTLRRLVSLLTEICQNLTKSEDEDERSITVISNLQDMVGRSIADLTMSTLIDISYHAAVHSGNGPEDGNLSFEFGNLNTQLNVVCEILEELFDCYWTSMKLLPVERAKELSASAPVRSVLGWCVDRMAYSAPPKGMLRLLCLVVKRLYNELNPDMHGHANVPDAPHNVKFLILHRAFLPWVPQSMHEEAFNLIDALNECAAEDFMGLDLLMLAKGLGDQAEMQQARTEASMDLLSTIIATKSPSSPKLTLSSLKSLENSSLGKQRISDGFPKKSRSNSASSARRLLSGAVPTPKKDPMSDSIYLHVILASCFDRFDGLSLAGKRCAGPSYMCEKIDAFIEHAAFCVKCLHSCARARNHREYVGAVLGDILSTCLAMQDHADGRVRLAGFEIFAAALDVLFLAKKTTMLVRQNSNTPTSTETQIMGASAAAARVTSQSTEMGNGVTELFPGDEGEATRSNSINGYSSSQELVRSSSLPASLIAARSEINLEERTEAAEEEDPEDEELEKKMQEIYSNGGSYSFRAEDVPLSDLSFEERGWQMLCTCVPSSLGIGKYQDIVVQRAGLEYLKTLLLNALRGRSSGASAIELEHVRVLWEAVNRIVGTPWRTLNGLVMWIICAILNVGIYSSVMARGRGATRHRSTQLAEFLNKYVFPRAESFLKDGNKETRLWGLRLIEVYVNARGLNPHAAQSIPSPPTHILKSLETLKRDWSGEVREASKSLLEAHYNCLNKKPTSQIQSFTTQAQNFMSMRRNQPEEPEETTDSSGIDLWFPPLPKPVPEPEMRVYSRTLEAFASEQVEGGEEIDVSQASDDQEDEFNEAFEEEEEGFEYSEGEQVEGQVETEEDDEIPVREDEEEEEEFDEDEEDEEEIEEPEEEQTLEPFEKEADEQGILIENDDDTSYDSSKSDKDPITDGITSFISPQTAKESERDSNSNLETNDNDEGVDKNSVQVRTEMDDGASTGSDEDDCDDAEFNFPSGSNPDSPKSKVSTTPTNTDDVMPSAQQVESDLDLDDTDILDEDDVVNVTEEDDILIDVDDVPKEKRLPKRDGRTGTFPGFTKTGSSDHSAADSQAKRQTSGSKSSSTMPDPSLNPDLDERRQVIRRTGSFTARAHGSLPLEEGDAPKLTRRRSVDVNALVSSFEAANVGKHKESETTSPTGQGIRLSRRGSLKSPLVSPRAAESPRSRGTEKHPSGDGRTEEKVEKEGPDSHGSNRPVKRKSSKTLSTPEETDMLQKKNSKDIDLIGGAFLNLSPRSNRALRGIKIDESEEPPENRSNASKESSSPSSSERPKTRPSVDNKPGSRGARRLPRAPAFVGGGRLTRRGSGSGPGAFGRSNSKGADEISTSSSTEKKDNDSSITNVAGSSTPSENQSSTRLPRGKSQTKKPSRLTGLNDSTGSEKRPDRSHRFSKRDPLRVSLNDDDSMDKELFEDMDISFESVDETGSQLRVGTPTAGGSNSSNTLADDGPGSGYKKRGANRSITEAFRFKTVGDEVEVKNTNNWSSKREKDRLGIRRDEESDSKPDEDEKK